MKKTAAFLLCLSMLSAGAVTAYAEQADANTAPGEATIATSVPDSHKITVTVTGNADVAFDGKTGTEFEVERLSEPVLEIKAKDGEKLTKVTLNGEDITDKLADGRYTLSPVYENETLDIQVQTQALPADDPSGPDSSAPDSKANDSSQEDKTSPVNDNPVTGVIGGVSICSGLIMAALITAKRNSKDKDEE